MTKVVICDDDPKQVAVLAKMIETASLFIDERVEIGLAGQSSQEVTEYLDQEKPYKGIYFLDIDLKENDNQAGLDLAEKTQEVDPEGQIIFVTTHAEMALLTFERRIGALDYIVKDENLSNLQARITDTLKLALDRLSKLNVMEKQTFSYKLGRLVKNINIDDVYYIATTQFPHKLDLVARGTRAEFVGNLTQVLEKTDFLVQVSQSFLVNPKNIVEVDLKKRTILLENGEEIKYARSAGKRMKEIAAEMQR